MDIDENSELACLLVDVYDSVINFIKSSNCANNVKDNVKVIFVSVIDVDGNSGGFIFENSKLDKIKFNC